MRQINENLILANKDTYSWQNHDVKIIGIHCRETCSTDIRNVCYYIVHLFILITEIFPESGSEFKSDSKHSDDRDEHFVAG